MAQREYFANNADSTLDGAINSSTTTVTLIDASRFPLSGFRISVEDEIMFCTSRATNVLTVIRGVESTTAASHADASPATHLLTAGSVEALKADAFAMMGLGRPPSTGNTYGDEFDDDNFTGWTAVNDGTTAFNLVEKDHFCSILMPNGSGNNIFVSWMKSTGSLSSGAEIRMGVRMCWGQSGYPQPTLWMADGATWGSGQQVGHAISPNEDCFILRGNTGYNTQTQFTNTATGYDASNSLLDINMLLRWNGGSSYTRGFSLDGIQWNERTDNSIYSFTPTYVGFGHTSWGGSVPTTASLRYFRTNF